MDKFHNVKAFQIELWQNCNNGCAFCLGMGTQILCKDSVEKNIEDIKKGDIVLTYDRDKNELVETEVLGTSSRYVTEKAYKISIRNRRIRITAGHKIAVADKKTKWITPENLIESPKKKICVPAYTTGDDIYQAVDSIEEVDFEGDVFNLETTEGTYIANEILVHNCYLNEARVESTPEERLQAIAKANELLDTLPEEYEAVGLIGGEFFQGQLETQELRDAFKNLIARLDKMVEDGRLQQVWVTASLIAPDLSDFEYCMGDIKNKDKFLICTSYDAVGRFKTPQHQLKWVQNVRKLKEQGYITHIQVIITQSFINAALKTRLLESLKKLGMVDFKTPTPHRESYFEAIQGIGEKSYHEIIEEKLHEFPDNFFIKDRESFLRFLAHVKEVFGIEKIAAFCSNEVRSNEVHLLAKDRVLTDRWEEGSIENAPCGHPWDSYCYLYDDHCARCDAAALFEE